MAFTSMLGSKSAQRCCQWHAQQRDPKFFRAEWTWSTPHLPPKSVELIRQWFAPCKSATCPETEIHWKIWDTKRHVVWEPLIEEWGTTSQGCKHDSQIPAEIPNNPTIFAESPQFSVQHRIDLHASTVTNTTRKFRRRFGTARQFSRNLRNSASYLELISVLLTGESVDRKPSRWSMRRWFCSRRSKFITVLHLKFWPEHERCWRSVNIAISRAPAKNLFTHNVPFFAQYHQIQLVDHKWTREPRTESQTSPMVVIRVDWQREHMGTYPMRYLGFWCPESTLDLRGLYQNLHVQSEHPKKIVACHFFPWNPTEQKIVSNRSMCFGSVWTRSMEKMLVWFVMEYFACRIVCGRHEIRQTRQPLRFRTRTVSGTMHVVWIRKSSMCDCGCGGWFFCTNFFLWNRIVGVGKNLCRQTTGLQGSSTTARRTVLSGIDMVFYAKKLARDCFEVIRDVSYICSASCKIWIIIPNSVAHRYVLFTCNSKVKERFVRNGYPPLGLRAIELVADVMQFDRVFHRISCLCTFFRKCPEWASRGTCPVTHVFHHRQLNEHWRVQRWRAPHIPTRFLIVHRFWFVWNKSKLQILKKLCPVSDECCVILAREELSNVCASEVCSSIQSATDGKNPALFLPLVVGVIGHRD